MRIPGWALVMMWVATLVGAYMLSREMWGRFRGSYT